MPRKQGVSPKRRPGVIRSDEASLAARDRAIQALKLRRAGFTFREIATSLEYKSPAGAWEAVQRLLKEAPQATVVELRAIEDERLDEITKYLHDMVKSGNRGAARAAEVLLKLMERRAKMHGLDEADRLEVSGAGGPLIVEFVRDERQDEHQRQVKERGLDK